MVWMLLGLVAAVLVLLYVIVTYNNFVVWRNRIDNAWSQIDVQLKRRFDLVPNLVETVKGYAKHEKDTFEMVTKARSALMGAQGVADKGKASNMMTNALKSLFAVAEAYPQLQANKNFTMLQEELAGIESKIAYSRQFYNDTVMQLNTAMQRFPSSLVAGLLAIKQREYFEIEEAAREPVKVKF